MAVIFGKILDQARHVRVHRCTTQFFFCRDFAGRGFEEEAVRRETRGRVPYTDDVVAHAGHVRPTCGRRSVEEGDDGQACRAQSREIGEQRAALKESLRPYIREDSRRRSRPNERKEAFVGVRFPACVEYRNPVAAVNAPGLKPAVVDDTAVRHTVNESDARDRVAAWHRFRVVRVVEQIAGEVSYREKGEARIEKPREALARRELAALDETRLALLRLEATACVELAEPSSHELEHVGAIARVRPERSRPSMRMPASTGAPRKDRDVCSVRSLTTPPLRRKSSITCEQSLSQAHKCASIRAETMMRSPFETEERREFRETIAAMSRPNSSPTPTNGTRPELSLVAP